jgi:hypothetical protein
MYEMWNLIFFIEIEQDLYNYRGHRTIFLIWLLEYKFVFDSLLI